MGKQKVVKLNLNNTFDKFDVVSDSGKLKIDGKDDSVSFEPLCVFTENKPKRAFYRGEEKLIFYVDGHTKALRFGQQTEELQSAWTKKEARELIKKEIAKAHAELKPIKTYQFIVLVILLVIMIILELSSRGIRISV